MDPARRPARRQRPTPGLRTLVATFACGLGQLSLPTAASCVSVQNADFSTGTLLTPPTLEFQRVNLGAQLPGWAVAGLVVVIRNGSSAYGSVPSVAGEYYVGLKMYGAPAVPSISQSLTGLRVGTEYTVSLFAAGRASPYWSPCRTTCRQYFEVDVLASPGGATRISPAQVVAPWGVFSRFAFNFTATAPTMTLRIKSASPSGGDITVMIDLVAVCEATRQPTCAPTAAPSTMGPTVSLRPTTATIAPTVRPTTAPTVRPVTAPTGRPATAPTGRPTTAPTDAPTPVPAPVSTSESSGGGGSSTLGIAVGVTVAVLFVVAVAVAIHCLVCYRRRSKATSNANHPTKNTAFVPEFSIERESTSYEAAVAHNPDCIASDSGDVAVSTTREDTYEMPVLVAHNRDYSDIGPPHAPASIHSTDPATSAAGSGRKQLLDSDGYVASTTPHTPASIYSAVPPTNAAGGGRKQLLDSDRYVASTTRGTTA
eukprot:m.295193 g.295193  ORF g.295193 m.295193 type:complete len:483 (-) comp27174_c2_seq2:111-1559(-)